MRRQIRRVGFLLVAAFIAVFLQLNYIQIFAAESIAGNAANKRKLLQEYSIRRGDIVTVDNVTVATSRETSGELKFRRVYPEGDLYGQITGYYSIVFGTDRIERTFNDELLGESSVISMQDIEDRLLGSGRRGDNVKLTIDSRLQELARNALGDQRGAVVALDPQSGHVRAMWSNPSFDPNPLASHNPATERAAFRDLTRTEPSPLLNIATSKGYPPGSTFKVVTAAAALDSGEFTPTSTFPDPDAIELPQTDETLTNFTQTSCTGQGRIDLFTALQISCDTTFALIALEIFGQVQATAEAMGFNSRIPVDIATQPSLFPDVGDDNLPFRAFAGIGQGNVVATPLQMALVAATVANGGDVPRPRLALEIQDPAGGVIERFSPEVLGEAMSSQTAAEVTRMMVAAVEDGTGTAAIIPGVPVAGKTGTAQSAEGAAPHAWFICFAPADNPQIAVAVIVENGGSLGSEATGGAVAAPIARQIIEADRQIRNW